MKKSLVLLILIEMILVVASFASAEFYGGLSTLNGEPVPITLDVNLSTAVVHGSAVYHGQALQLDGTIDAAHHAQIQILSPDGAVLATLFAWEPPMTLFGITLPVTSGAPRWLVLVEGLAPTSVLFPASGSFWRW